jgi:hypothetical protein
MPASRLVLLLLGAILLAAGVAVLVIGSLGDGGAGVPVTSPAAIPVLGAAAVVFALARRERLASGPRMAARLVAGLMSLLSGMGAVGTVVLVSVTGPIASNGGQSPDLASGPVAV